MIVALEAAMREHPDAIRPEDFVTRHYFANGLYAREIEIPAGVRLVGKAHFSEHINIVSKGRIVVFTDEGEREITAPCTFVAKPGTKRAGYAIEDTVWTTIHSNPTHETDIAKLERELVTDDNAGYLAHCVKEIAQ
jgi:quercetin dioxygenase-like cupin family protein